MHNTNLELGVAVNANVWRFFQQNYKDVHVRISVDAGGDELKSLSFQVVKGHQKSKQTSTLIFLIKEM